MSVAALVLSMMMLGVGGWLVVRLWGRGGGDVFWVLVAAVAGQIGTAAVLASIAGRFTAGGVLGAQAGLVLILAAAAKGWRRERCGRAAATDRGSAAWAAGALAAVVMAVLVLSAVRQAASPIAGWDECNYHGPRMLYWLQAQSVLPFPTHNERQTLFPGGAELVSVWPLLFVKAEWPARMAFWLCFPLGAAGVWSVCRGIGVPRAAAWAGVALWVTTPAVVSHAEGLKSDAWLAVYLLGAAYWLACPRPEGERPGLRFLWAGAFIALAVNVKTTALAALPGAVLLPFLMGGAWGVRGRRMAGLGAGLALGAAVGGLLIVLGHAVLRHGHPLGPAALRSLVRAEMEWGVLRTNVARALLYLVEFPEVFSEGVRLAVEARGQRAAEWLGAMRVLRYEEPLVYPGRFEYRLHGTALSYSLGGLLWAPMLAVGGVHLVRARWKRRPAEGAAALAVLAVSTFAGVVLAVRWMGGGPNRFWLGAYALAVPVIVFFGWRWAERSRILHVVAVLLLAWAVYPALRGLVASTDAALRQPRSLEALNGQYAAALEHIGPGARILLIAGNTTREWPLLDPRGGFRNRVYSWALAGFEPARVAAMVDEREISHIVMEGDHMLAARFQGPVAVRPVLTALLARGDIREVRLDAPGPRLFVRERE